MKCLKHDREMVLVKGIMVCQTCTPSVEAGKVPLSASHVAKLKKWSGK